MIWSMARTRIDQNFQLESVFCRVEVELPAGEAVFGGSCFATKVLALEFNSGIVECNSVTPCGLEVMEAFLFLRTKQGFENSH